VIEDIGAPPARAPGKQVSKVENPAATALERFRTKWARVRVKETR
jgi:hypothetical protein